LISDLELELNKTENNWVKKDQKDSFRTYLRNKNLLKEVVRVKFLVLHTL